MTKFFWLASVVFIPFSGFSQEESEYNKNLRKIEEQYGEQWSFCTCVLTQDSINRAMMESDLSDTQFDSLFVLADEADKHCKAFLIASDMNTPEARLQHEKKVKKCLENNQLTMEERYVPVTADHFSQLEKIATIDIGIPKVSSEFYVRLYSLLGVEPTVMYEGYEFYIMDEKTQTSFTLALNGFGIAYWSDTASQQVMDVINEFHDYLFNQFNDLKECQNEFQHDYGRTVIGYRDGQIIEEFYED